MRVIGLVLGKRGRFDVKKVQQGTLHQAGTAEALRRGSCGSSSQAVWVLFKPLLFKVKYFKPTEKNREIEEIPLYVPLKCHTH